MIWNKINILLPTYHRILNGKLKTFVTSVLHNVSNINNLFFTFLANYDDLETIRFIEHLKVNKCLVINKNIENPHLGKFYNRLFDETPDRDSIVTMLGDDMEFKTKEFDKIILDKINSKKGIGIFYCDDGFQHDKMCVNLFLTREFISLTEKPFMCQMFAAYFIDTVWYRLGKKSNTLCYIPEVLIQHNHFSLKKVPNKDITSRRLDVVKDSFKSGYTKVDKYVNDILPVFKKNLQRYEKNNQF